MPVVQGATLTFGNVSAVAVMVKERNFPLSQTGQFVFLGICLADFPPIPLSASA